MISNTLIQHEIHFQFKDMVSNPQKLDMAADVVNFS